MNEKIIEFAQKAGLEDPILPFNDWEHPELEKFAELIVRRCGEVAHHHTPDYEDLEYSHLIRRKILEHFGIEQ